MDYRAALKFWSTYKKTVPSFVFDIEDYVSSETKRITGHSEGSVLIISFFIRITLRRIRLDNGELRFIGTTWECLEPYVTQQLIESPTKSEGEILDVLMSLVSMAPGSSNEAFQVLEELIKLRRIEVESGVLPEDCFTLQLPSTATKKTIIDPTEPMSVKQFLSDRTVKTDDSSIGASELYHVYEDWCKKGGRLPLSQRSFGIEMTGLGYQRKRIGSVHYLHLKLKELEPRKDKAVVLTSFDKIMKELSSP